MTYIIKYIILKNLIDQLGIRKINFYFFFAYSFFNALSLCICKFLISYFPYFSITAFNISLHGSTIDNKFPQFLFIGKSLFLSFIL